MPRHPSRGLRHRRAQAQPGPTMTGALSRDARAAASALERQERVARDEPAVPGSLRPSEIRARARTKGKKPYTNDAAHGETITFAPSEKTQRIVKISYGG